MGSSITTVGFDADDTLWHNETVFQLTQERFAALLRDHADPDHLADRLLAAERRNIGHYGFGVKGFVLSMIETAIEVTEQRVPAAIISDLLAAGQEMLQHPIELLPHAQETVEELAADHHLVLITKGDLFHQERKLAQSGLGEFFDAVEIVSNKTPETYARALADPSRAAMIGNSMRSDVLPAIEAGAHGIFVPFELAWALEHAEAPEGHDRFHEVVTLQEVPALLKQL